MRIALNALFLIPNRVGGSETYLRGLIAGLERVCPDDQFLLIVGPEAAQSFATLAGHWRLAVSPVASTHRAQRLCAEQVWLPRVAAALRADIVHSAGYTGPLAPGLPAVTSIHDMNYRRHPEDLSLAERLVYAMLIPRVARRSARVLTLTKSAQADIVRFCDIPSAKVKVVPGAPRTEWPPLREPDDELLARLGIAGPFVLSVAAAYPHKNLARLVEAFPLEPSSARQVQLVLVGLSGRGATSVRQRALARSDIVKELGWVSDEVLAALYRQALALAFPSLYEGFGLPILEAMALGTPVLTSNYGAMAEVADGAAELIDPHSVDQIRRGLGRIATDPNHRQDLRQRGFARAREYSWDRTARMVCSVYGEVCTCQPCCA
jgi:glycosyltransferase involved in cell wall biosynthesis